MVKFNQTETGVRVCCPRCGRLLGMMDGGEFVNKHGKQTIKAERAEISCPRCGTVSKVGVGRK